MSLAQITEKIRSDAGLEAKEIISRANAAAQDILRRAEEEGDSVRSAFARRFDVERPEIFRRREIVASLDVKKMLLRSRRDVIDDVYTAALDKLRRLPKDQYLSFCEALLASAVTTKEEVLCIGADEKYLDKAWLDSYNQRHGSKLTLADEPAGISGGFILENGRVGVNCSWEMLLRMAREKSEADVIRRLFQPAG